MKNAPNASLQYAISIVLATTIVCITGCKKPVSQDLFIGCEADPVPPVQLLRERAVPRTERRAVTLHIPQQKRPIDEGAIVNVGNGVKSGLKVVISVPEIQEQENQETNGSSKPSDKGDRDLTAFRTDGFYHLAEQEIEKSLLRQKLQVVDRAKFEAKLRELRDEDRRVWVRESDRRHMLEGALAELRKKLDEGKINQDQYIDEAQKARERITTAGKSRKKNQNEIVDISELIRAAQSGDVRADYLLQINEFTIRNSYDRAFNVQAAPEIQAFLKQNPGLRVGDRVGKELPASIPTPWFTASCNAKLIDIKTGNIVWVGEHQIESIHAIGSEGVKISFSIMQQATNGSDVNQAIAAYNKTLQARYAEAKAKANELNAIYREANAKREFKKKDDLEAWQRQIRSRANRAKDTLAKSLSRYHQILREPPTETNTPWEYTYTVDKPLVTPNLSALANHKDLRSEEMLNRHTRDLAREVAKQLIMSIDISE